MGRDIYGAIMHAGRNGKGLRLTADETYELSFDSAIVTRAAVIAQRKDGSPVDPALAWPFGGGVEDEEEAYEIGKREGYEAAVSDIDLMTGGDGEYRFCTNGDPERHTPDAATMKQRIADRFAALSPRSADGQEWLAAKDGAAAPPQAPVAGSEDSASDA